ncbi:Glutamine amidotransferases class-II [Rhodococcus wratislaviensis]|uniref:Glutamine amidotransferases class-II n=1 Tax=Rhodococcus wratislaviensis TaxID=44752 RepID=A0A402CIR0_RHOWR|nr:Glutamine amidotransferases class-II [Rhodococcus wratislaviensis]
MLSEPLRDLPGPWNEVPESAAGVVRPGDDDSPVAADSTHLSRTSRLPAYARGSRSDQLGFCAPGVCAPR